MSHGMPEVCSVRSAIVSSSPHREEILDELLAFLGRTYGRRRPVVDSIPDESSLRLVPHEVTEAGEQDTCLSVGDALERSCKNTEGGIQLQPFFDGPRPAE